MRVVLLGAPGAGKGTQATSLGEALNVPHVATGDLFRAAVSQKTALGLEAKTFMDRGELVPDRVTISMLLERVSEEDARDGCVLDGFPRTVAQARALAEALSEREQSLDRVLLIDVSEDELVRRLSGRWICRTCQTPYHEVSNPPKNPGVCDSDGGILYQRDDDKPETVRNRLRIYEEQTAPLIDFYEADGSLKRIDGEQEIGAVRDQLLAAIH